MIIKISMEEIVLYSIFLDREETDSYT